MNVVNAELVDTGRRFKRWNNDLHRPEVLIWTDRRTVRTTLDDRGPDGTVVLAADDVGQLGVIAEGGRLAVVFRADRGRVRKGDVVPLFTTDYVVDRQRGLVEVRFASHQTTCLHSMPVPIIANLGSRMLFQRSRTVNIVGLAPYQGEFVVDDPSRTLSPGMIVDLDLWLPWTGQLRLRVQLTSCRVEFGRDWFMFRMIDRRSVRNAAVVLVGTVDGFGFADLRSAGVRQGQVTRLLTVQTVSDDATFQKALGVRLAGNRNFGRLAGVSDGMAVADDLDSHSINFICLLGDKPLGAGRVVVNGGDRALSEIESETDGLPDWVWSGGFMEVSRLATHPDYRSRRVTLALFREIGRLAFHLGCRYLLLDAIDKLVPLYEKIGAKQLPISKTHPYSKETVRVMAVDFGAQVSRLDRRWLYSQVLFGPVLRHHLDTSTPRTVRAFVDRPGRLPYWIKRTLSHVG